MELDNNMNLTETDGRAEEAMPPAYVSAVSIVEDSADANVRILIRRNTDEQLASFTVSYRFSAVGKGGSISDTRFFSLLYDRDGLNTKDIISMRIKIPDGYNAVGCTAYVSRIVCADGTEKEFSFGDADAVVRSYAAEGFDPESFDKKKKRSKKAKAAIISLASAAVAAVAVFGGITLSGYIGVKRELNALIDSGRYAEAYKISEEYSSATLEKTVCGNIVKKCLGERDYTTAYVYAVISGKEKTVFDRVKYEIENSDPTVLSADAFVVLCKLTDDEEFDETVKNHITRAAKNGDYYSAVAASELMRDEKKRNLMRRSLIVDGVCDYAALPCDAKKYDFAEEYFLSHMTGDEATDRSIAAEIVSRCAMNGDEAGAVVMAARFAELFDSFESPPESVKISAGNLSISRSLDCAYLMLTDEQKRAYHAETLALSEEMFTVRNVAISSLGINDAVSVSTYENRTAVLERNGKVTHLTNNGHNTVSNIPAGINAVQIATGLGHTVILCSDGTVAAVGDNSAGQCEVSEWSDIVEIAAGRYFTLGLHSDGTVVACGSNLCGQCDVSDCRNVIAVAACDQSSVMLFSDGTVHIRGSCALGLYNANSFTNVEQIKAGGCAVIARMSDGLFAIADGSVNSSYGDVSNWVGDDVVTFAVGSQWAAYADKNGKIHKIGDGAPK